MRELKEKSFKTSHASTLAHTVSELLILYGCRTKNLHCCLFNHYMKSFEGIPTIDLLKKIKLSFCIFFSSRTRQEKPEGESFKLFPSLMMGWINKKTDTRVSASITSRRKRIGHHYRLLHSLLQCKNVLEGPNKSHILQAYEKHRSIMGRPANKTPIDILEKAYEKGKEFGLIVRKYYEPTKTSSPTTSATFDCPRSKGGQKTQLLKKVTSKLAAFRVEPTVLYLAGKPGCGKSRLVMNICRKICHYENFDFSTSIFTRNCTTTHWDGYRQQPIVVLDDLGQLYNNALDLNEIVSIVSDNCYPLPMADLKEKGIVFTSKYLILCSNLVPNSLYQISDNLSLRTIRDNRAFYRRLHVPYYIESALGSSVKSVDLSSSISKVMKSDRAFENLTTDLTKTDCTSRDVFIEQLTSKMLKRQRLQESRVLMDIPELSGEYPWIQNIVNINDNVYLPDGNDRFNRTIHRIQCQKNIEFPLYPPLEIPSVRVAAVAKSLGTRMVTCAEHDVRVLKPLQVAMWKALGDFTQFAPTHGKDLQTCVDSLGSRSSDEYLLSGDYESATDNLNMDFSNMILQGIIDQLDHAPTSFWARYENGSHEVTYPPWTGLDSVLQTTGQLMGSLLSFPLLCLANDILTDIVGIKKKIINGDDLLCYATIEQKKSWSQRGEDVGLIPSIGKNFFSDRFGTFNSQLIFDMKVKPYSNLKLVFRQEKKLEIANCFSKAMSIGIKPCFIVRNNKKILEGNPRSLDVPLSHGGLGSSFTPLYKKYSRQARIVYLSEIMGKVKKNVLPSEFLPDGYVWITHPKRIGPCDPIKRQKQSIFAMENGPISNGLSTNLLTYFSLISEENSMKKLNLSYSILNRNEKKFIAHPLLRDFINNGDLEKCPSLNEIEYVTVPMKKTEKLKFYNDYSKFNKFILESLSAECVE